MSAVQIGRARLRCVIWPSAGTLLNLREPGVEKGSLFRQPSDKTLGP